MREKPILFNTEMVKAILDLIKKNTRRPIKIKFLPGYNPEWTEYKPVFEYGYFFLANSKGEPATKKVKAPCIPGDILWVRETWQKLYPWLENGMMADEGKYYYAADGEPDIEMTDGNGFHLDRFRWRPSIHMPREAARIILKVKDVRVERVQDITEDGAKAEGVGDPYDYQQPEYYEQPHMRGLEINKSAFAGLWDSLYNSWNSNPYVWVIEFEKVKKE